MVLAGVFLLATANISRAQTARVSSSFFDTLLCVNGYVNVPLTITGEFDDTNIFRIEISNASGSFSNPTKIGEGFGNGQGGVLAACKLPANIGAGTGYRMRVISNAPVYTSGASSHDIRVSNYPTMTITPPDAACMGSNLTIKMSTPAANPTVLWKLPNGSNISGVSYTKTNANYYDSGMYLITVTSYKCSTTDSVRAQVHPQPDITGWDADSAICEGEMLKISPKCNVCNLPAGIVNYDWSYPPGAKSGQSFINLGTTTPANHGWYKLTMSLGSCTTTDSFFTKIVQKPAPPTASNNSPVCVDDILDLTATSTNQTNITYKWVGPNGFTGNRSQVSIPNVTKPYEGDYSVSIIANGCESLPTRTSVVIGNPLSKLRVTGDTSLCPGEKLQLSLQTNEVTGIEWRKVPYTTQVISVARTFGKTAVAYEDSGMYVVSQKILGCVSPETRVHVVVPNLKKPVPKNNGPLCAGVRFELTSVGSDGARYSWTGPNGFTSNQQNPVIEYATDASAGKYTVTASIGRCEEKDSTVFVMKPTPVVSSLSSNGPVCVGNTLIFNSSSSLPNSTFEWSGPDSFKSDIPSPSFVYTDSKKGKYQLKVMAEGCESQPETIEIFTREGAGSAEATSNSPITEEETLKLFGTNDKEDVQYFWSGPGGFTSTEKNPVLPNATYKFSGRYQLVCVNGECSTTTYVDVQVKDVLGIKLYLYPNPNQGKFTINGLTQTDELHHVNVYNSFGVVVYRTELYPHMALFNAEIDIPNITSGVYILQITSAGEKRIERFVVTKP